MTLNARLDSHRQHGVLEGSDILIAGQEPQDRWSSGIGMWQGNRRCGRQRGS
jgi:hypothetical protein